jgi:hypothetical protein
MNDNNKDFCVCGGGGECRCVGISFLDPVKLKEQEDKIKSGETVCNTSSPEGCESCSG